MSIVRPALQTAATVKQSPSEQETERQQQQIPDPLHYRPLAAAECSTRPQPSLYRSVFLRDPVQKRVQDVDLGVQIQMMGWLHGYMKIQIGSCIPPIYFTANLPTHPPPFQSYCGVPIVVIAVTRANQGSSNEPPPHAEKIEMPKINAFRDSRRALLLSSSQAYSVYRSPFKTRPDDRDPILATHRLTVDMAQLLHVQDVQDVSVVGVHVVSCRTPGVISDLPNPFRLGPLEQLGDVIIPINSVFVYRRPNVNANLVRDEFMPIGRLQHALEGLLDHYPHLTGRITVNPDDGRWSIWQMGSGVHLVEATCTGPLGFASSDSQDIRNDTRPGRILNLPAGGNGLFPHLELDPVEVMRGPILIIQHTRFSCGSVALGIRITHKVCDAEGYFQLVRDLSAIYRSPTCSSDVVERPHILSYLHDLNRETCSANELSRILAFRPTLFQLNDEPEDRASESLLEAKDSVRPAPGHVVPPVSGRFYHISSDQQRLLKSMATLPQGDGWISTFEALSALLYQSIHKARMSLRRYQDQATEVLAPLSRPDFLTSVNVRTRLDLPDRYFPNAPVCVSTHLEPDVLARIPLWQVAQRIHEIVRSQAITSGTELRETMRWIQLQPDKSKIKQEFIFGNGSFMISQWHKFDMYSAAFDNEPDLVSPPFTAISLIDGLTYVLPAEDRSPTADKGAFVCNLSLANPLWDVLEQDPVFSSIFDSSPDDPTAEAHISQRSARLSHTTMFRSPRLRSTPVTFTGTSASSR
ncbi:transferase family-domain-containing protein [Filobasidium floriforme]|uniref:transferase family-domain-containing protein n=1 Tax=Filobasidium floriforme TaxID=5210 RepID=UPI001E8DE355|nr:transferase family-domain-containing protein [Filobasidium floriforme]KAH8083242.1 transferase family-domain-containing protein [Filobasidium floriforme]